MTQSIFSKADSLQLHKKIFPTMDVFVGVLREFSEQLFNRQINSGRSSRPEMFCKKGVLRNFAKFTGKQLCQSLLFNKAADRACNFIKKRLWHRCFPVNFAKFLRIPFLIEHI